MSDRPGLLRRVRNLTSNLRALTLEGFGGYSATSSFTSAAGVQVEHNNALEISAVMACVRVLSDSIASLPLKLYERDEQSRMEARTHPLYRVLHDKPNPVMTSFTFREVLMLHLALWGNFYAEIVRDSRGSVAALWPIPPNKVHVEFYSDGGMTRRRYHVHYGEVVLSDSDTLHIPGLGYNGYIGLSPISLARDTLGLSKATELYGSKFFSNDATPGGILTHPGNLKEESVKRLKADWQNLHKSSSNARRIAVLEEGMDFKQIGIPPEDSQFLETRKFQVAEIARIFRVPPHMIADVERSTSWGTGIEQQTMGFVQYTLRPWLVRIEQAISAQLLRGNEPERYYPEFSLEGLLRGDTESRYQSYAIARQWGWMSINEIRRAENMEPVPEEQGGDLYISPLNMAPASQVTEKDAGDRSRRTEARASNDAALTRVKVARSFEDPLKEAALKAVKRERAEVLEQVNRAATTRDAAELERWVNEYYRGDQPPQFIRDNLEPVLRGLFRAVGQMAADEVSAPYDSAKFEQWQNDYLERFTWKWAIRSRTQLLNLLREHRDDFEEFVTERLDQWVERKPTKVSDEERVQAASEAARTVWSAAGFMGLRWVVAGDSCEFCTSLDGTEIKMAGAFVEDNGTVTGTQGGVLQPGGAVFTPPVHAGCNCTIVPV